MVPEDVSERGDFNPAELYEMVRGRDEAAAKTGSILAHPGLKSKLRAYQSRAVKWMIARENREDLVQNDDESFGYWVELSVRDHGFDGEQEDFNRHKSPAVFYFSSLSGCLARLKDTRVFDIRGGILADEMGLGKTIEVRNNRYFLFQWTIY
jgi:SNF2 family DNA or RNA helicase